MKVIKPIDILSALEQMSLDNLLPFLHDVVLMVAQEEEICDFDRRNPGDVEGWVHALRYGRVLLGVGADLTPKILYELYARLSAFDQHPIVTGKLRTEACGMNLRAGYNASFDGLMEILERIATEGEATGICLSHNVATNAEEWEALDGDSTTITHLNVGKTPEARIVQAEKLFKLDIFSYRAPAPESVGKLFDSLIEDFNGNITEKGLSEFKNEFLRLHPFRDYNTRVASVVDFWTSIRLGHYPSARIQPNRIGLTSTRECLEEDRQGRKVASWLCAGENLEDIAGGMIKRAMVLPTERSVDEERELRLNLIHRDYLRTSAEIYLTEGEDDNFDPRKVEDKRKLYRKVVEPLKWLLTITKIENSPTGSRDTALLYSTAEKLCQLLEKRKELVSKENRKLKNYYECEHRRNLNAAREVTELASHAEEERKIGELLVNRQKRLLRSIRSDIDEFKRYDAGRYLTKIRDCFQGLIREAETQLSQVSVNEKVPILSRSTFFFRTKFELSNCLEKLGGFLTTLDTTITELQQFEKIHNSNWLRCIKLSLAIDAIKDKSALTTVLVNLFSCSLIGWVELIKLNYNQRQLTKVEAGLAKNTEGIVEKLEQIRDALETKIAEMKNPSQEQDSSTEEESEGEQIEITIE